VAPEWRGCYAPRAVERTSSADSDRRDSESAKPGRKERRIARAAVRRWRTGAVGAASQSERMEATVSSGAPAEAAGRPFNGARLHAVTAAYLGFCSSASSVSRK